MNFNKSEMLKTPESSNTIQKSNIEQNLNVRASDTKTDDAIKVVNNDNVLDKSGNEVLNEVGSELSELQESRINGILDEFKNNPEYRNEHDVIDELLNLGLDEKQVEEKLFGNLTQGKSSNYKNNAIKNAPEYLDVRLMPKTKEEFEAKKDYYVQAATEFANLEIKNGTVSEDKEDQAVKIKDTLNSYTKNINELQKHNPLTEEDKLKLETFKVIHDTIKNKYDNLHTSAIERSWKGFQELLGKILIASASKYTNRNEDYDFSINTIDKTGVYYDINNKRVGINISIPFT